MSEAKPTKVSEIKGRLTKIVTSPTTGFSYRIRGAQALDFAASGLSSVLKLKPGALEKDASEWKQDDIDLTSIEENTGRFLVGISRLVERCTVEPRLSSDDAAIADNSRVHISEIGGDETFLWGAITEFDMPVAEAVEEVEAVVGNGNGAES